MRGEILGFERRRRWSDAEKLGIVRSVGVDEASVTQGLSLHSRHASFILLARMAFDGWELYKTGVSWLLRALPLPACMLSRHGDC
jgi:hypothetical protein